MLLTRVTIRRKGNGYALKGSFRGSAGKRVQLGLGTANDLEKVADIIKIVAENDSSIDELRAIGRV